MQVKCEVFSRFGSSVDFSSGEPLGGVGVPTVGADLCVRPSSPERSLFCGRTRRSATTQATSARQLHSSNAVTPISVGTHGRCVQCEVFSRFGSSVDFSSGEPFGGVGVSTVGADLCVRPSSSERSLFCGRTRRSAPTQATSARQFHSSNAVTPISVGTHGRCVQCEVFSRFGSSVDFSSGEPLGGVGVSTVGVDLCVRPSSPERSLFCGRTRRSAPTQATSARQFHSSNAVTPISVGATRFAALQRKICAKMRGRHPDSLV